jgi:hypothetical protein
MARDLRLQRVKSPYDDQRGVWSGRILQTWLFPINSSLDGCPHSSTASQNPSTRCHFCENAFTRRHLTAAKKSDVPMADLSSMFAAVSPRISRLSTSTEQLICRCNTARHIRLLSFLLLATLLRTHLDSLARTGISTFTMVHTLLVY